MFFMLGMAQNGGLEVHILASGSDGNSVIFRHKGTTIMVDAGLSGRDLVRRMSSVGVDPREIDAILLTHEHSDHVKGAGVLSRQYKIPICANAWTIKACNIGNVEKHLVFDSSTSFDLGSLRIDPIPILHNAMEPNAFHIHAGERQCLIATDLGRVTPPIFAALREVDLALLESNHDVQMLIHGPYPPALKSEIRSDRGHLSNLDCARALWATHSEERRVFLVHISRNNNTPEIARRTVSKTLGCNEEDIDCLDGPQDVRTIDVH